MGADFGSASLKMAGSLILILGLIIILFYVLKRLRIGSLSLNRCPKMLLLGTLSLAPKRTVALVEIGDQWLIVGVGTENVNLLLKLDRPQNINDIEPGTEDGVRSFQSLLKSNRFWQRAKERTRSRGNA